jgi:hypothetical protein
MRSSIPAIRHVWLHDELLNGTPTSQTASQTLFSKAICVERHRRHPGLGFMSPAINGCSNSTTPSKLGDRLLRTPPKILTLSFL